ncbi:MAG TPA: hypothetical protein VGL49_00080 [Acidimicrobiales bacterium]
MPGSDEGRTGLAATVLAKLGQRRPRSVVVRSAVERIDTAALETYVAGLGEDAATVRRLDAAVEVAMSSLVSLSSLTAPLALQYLERLARPIPALTLEMGVQTVSRAYVAHQVVETDPAAYGASDVPVLGTLPPLRRGFPPQDLLTRVVKATRRDFELIRALSGPAWDGFVYSLTRRAHEQAAQPGPDGLLDRPVVDGLARFGWLLRQVDLHYGLEPEGR